jgi:hypothetical protein
MQILREKAPSTHLMHVARIAAWFETKLIGFARQR